MNFLSHLLPDNDNSRKWVAISITVILAGWLSVWAVYAANSYGIALFIGIPFFIGICPTVLYGYKKELTTKEAWHISLLSILIFFSGVFLFAMEGMICILMVSPLALFFTWVGSRIGLQIITDHPKNTPPALIILFVGIPSLAFIEKDNAPEIRSITTSIEINTDPGTIWKNVIEFPQLPAPKEIIFKTGIAYPMNAEIHGTGPGAVRYCNFSTGSFVEPITIWEENKVLRFDVTDQPNTMNELSIWKVEAPHLHNFFVSTQGEFKLTEIQNGKTLLEGATWYYHRIQPAFYWQLWSDFIVHKIHMRVLEHIKSNAEILE